MKIELDRVGKIVSGPETGHFIKVVRGSENDNSYLVLKSPNFTFQDGFDDWVEDQECLEAYFEEADWEIQWM